MMAACEINRPDPLDYALCQIAGALPCECPFPLREAAEHCVNCRARLLVARAIGLLELPLLFHSGSPWGPMKQERWKELTGTDEATTRVMCRTIRALLSGRDTAHTTNQETPMEKPAPVPDDETPSPAPEPETPQSP